MSLATIHTRATLGIQAPAITVEAHISNGLPGFVLVGLPETTVKEARDRVRSALINSGFIFPAKRITVSLAPADLPKEGGRYDLPIALAILAASEQIPADKLAHYEFLGELALSGALRRVSGAIPAALASSHVHRQLILPSGNSLEIGLIAQGNSWVAENLLAVCGFLQEENTLAQGQRLEDVVDWDNRLDLQDIIGQSQAKRVLEITAAGGHNLLLLGPPGTGKTMLANRLTGLLPPLTEQEALEAAAINGLLHSNELPAQWRCRAFRAPHHSASMAALIGGGSIPVPAKYHWHTMGYFFWMSYRSLNAEYWIHCASHWNQAKLPFPVQRLKFVFRLKYSLSPQ